MNAERETQTVLITGATDGLGKAAALLLAERGYRVFAAGRSAEKRTRLNALANEKKLPLETLEMDVCDDSSVQRAVSSVLQKSGAIDVLINNAGFVQVGAVEDLGMHPARLHRDQHSTYSRGTGAILSGAVQERPLRRHLRILFA